MSLSSIKNLKTHPAYRADIDGLRAIAVLGVVIFHAFPTSLPSGFIGVDVFFVISGFLIGSILQKSLENDSFSFADFYARRIRRIFPALIFVLATCLIAGYILFLPDEYQQLGKHSAAGSAFIANFAYWSESGYFDTAAETKPLLHLWSLAIEEQFYLIWPIFLWLAWKSRLNLAVITLFVIAASFVVNIYQTYTDQATAFFLLPSRAWELLAGSILAWYSLRKKTTLHSSRPIEHIIGILGMILIVVPMFLNIPQIEFPGWYATFPVAGAFLVIAAGPSSLLNKHLLSRKIMVWIGLISFPLYLWHWPILSFVRIIENKNPSIEIIFYAVTAAFILSSFTYYIIEIPLRKKPKTKTNLSIMIGVIILILTIGYKISLGEKKEEIIIKKSENNCMEKFPNWKKSTDTPCYFLKENDNKIAIIGDSHASQLFPGLMDKIGDDGLIVFSASCAAPFINISTGLKNPENKNKRKENYKLINSAYEYIINDRSITTVMLAHHPWCSFEDTIDIENKDENNYQESLKNGIKRTIEALQKSGKKIIFIYDNPIVLFDINSCKKRPYSISKTESQCSFPRWRHDNLEYYKNYREIVEELRENHPEINTIDLAESFCDDDSCHLEKNGILLYLDRNHLNREGSELVAPQILRALMPLTYQ